MQRELNKNKQEDKKAFKGFIKTIVLAALAGIVTGIVIGFAKLSLRQGVQGIGTQIWSTYICPYGIWFTTVFCSLCIVILYQKSKNIFAVWDGENEEAADKADVYLSYALWISSMEIVLDFFIFGASISLFLEEASFRASILFLGGMAVSLVCICVAQQKIVNLTKEFNPEKCGSIYDKKFQKKWEESCDEAEKWQIYKSGYHAYKVAQYACIGLWFVCVVGDFIWEFGAVPVAMVTLLWGIMTTAYTFEALRIVHSQD